MGFLSDVVNKIRGAWARDKESVAFQMAKGSTALTSPSYSYDVMQAYGYAGMADYLRLEADLLSRYVDYEEMDDYAPISSALTIYADDATQVDSQTNRTIWVTSADHNTQTELDDLVNVRLRLDEEVWEIGRTLCKYGVDYEELLVTADGVMGLNFLPPPTVRRIEGPRGELFGFIQDFQGRFGYTPEEFKAILAKRTSAIQSSGGSPIPFVEDGVAALEDWEVVNFRLRGKARRSVYGSSVLEAARWIWKRLILLEDTALIYRLQRAPERFAFYIDVGDLPPAEAMAYLNKVKNQYKKKSYVNPTTNKVDLKFNPLSSDEDFFIPVRQGTEGAKVEVIAGPVWQHMEDIEYFLNHLFSAIAIPKAYLAQDENVARAVLSSEDVRFARSVLRVQRELRNGVSKICRVHLAALGARPEDHRFDIHLPVPSAIFELSQIEARNARAELAARLKEFMSLHWIYKNVFNLSDSDIELVIKQQEEDSKRLALMQANAEAAAQQVAMTSQAAMQNMQPPPTPGLQPGVGMESRLLVRPRNVPLYVPGRPLLPLGIRPMTEEELFRGHGRESEKRAHDKLEKLLKNDVVLRRSIEELRGVVQDLVQLRR